jgi:acetyl esterase/lipase
VALKAAGLPEPCCAVMFSPWADLTLSGDSVTGKAAVDPALTPAGLRLRSADVQVSLEVTPGVAHVFQAFAALLDEAGAALDSAGAFICARLSAQ